VHKLVEINTIQDAQYMHENNVNGKVEQMQCLRSRVNATRTGQLCNQLGWDCKNPIL